MRLLVAFFVVTTCAISMAVDEVSSGFSYNSNPAMSWLREKLSPGEAHSRQKRYLQFPVGSSMEVKWSLNLPFETFTDYSAKVQLALPIKIPFPDALVAGEKNRRSDGDGVWKYEYLDAQGRPQIQETHPEFDDRHNWLQRRRRMARQERSAVYNRLEGAFKEGGLESRHCLLRTICEIAEAPFEQGLLGEILNTLFSASLPGRPDHPSEDKTYDEYIEAELHGKLNGKCEERYSKCKSSVFDIVPYIVHHIKDEL